MAPIGTVPGSDVIVKAALGLAHELGIQTVADGVESAAQIARLQAWDCPVAQGPYFSGPLTAAEASALLGAGVITPATHDLVAAAVAGPRDRAGFDGVQEEWPAAKPGAKRSAGQG